MQQMTEIELEQLRPISVFFNSIPENQFVNTIDDLTKGNSEAVEGKTSCYFPKDLDENDVYNFGFNGIDFSFLEENVTVDIPTFRKYLRMACEAYWQEHPESKQILEKYLARPQPPLEDGASEEWIRRRDAGKYPKPYSEFE